MDSTFILLKLMPRGFKNYLKYRFSIPSVEISLSRIKRNGFNPRYAIDVGAYVGEWTAVFKKIFPESAVMMIEAQAEKKYFLDKICKQYPDCRYIIALVGAEEEKDTPFLTTETGSQVLRGTPEASVNKELCSCTHLPMTTLDNLMAETAFRNPQFIKLDVQGYELEVLKGAESVLRSVEVIMMEISLIGLIKGAPTFYDAVKFMHELGFSLYYICNFIRRPVDDALWQIDAIFVRNSSKLADVSVGW